MVEADDPKAMTDSELLSVCEDASGEPVRAIVEGLSAEIARRGLDV